MFCDSAVVAVKNINQIGGAPSALTIPPVPKLVVPDKLKKSFPEFAVSVDEHWKLMEDWRKKVNVVFTGSPGL